RQRRAPQNLALRSAYLVGLLRARAIPLPRRSPDPSRHGCPDRRLEPRRHPCLHAVLRRLSRNHIHRRHIAQRFPAHPQALSAGLFQLCPDGHTHLHGPRHPPAPRRLRQTGTRARHRQIPPRAQRKRRSHQGRRHLFARLAQGAEGLEDHPRPHKLTPREPRRILLSMAARDANRCCPPAGPHYFADLYRFDWSAFRFRLPLVSAAAVAICLFAGIAAGHPGAGLIAGGGAFTVGFGPNQRIADSRLIPMMGALLATSAATLAGTVAGHKDYWLLIAAGVMAIVYAVLTTRHTGLAWVGQQSAVALLVASAFPTGAEAALIRAGLVAAGGLVQLLVTSAGLRLIPNLHRDFLTMASGLLNSVWQED